MVFALLPILIIGGIVVLIVRAVGGRGDGPDAGGTAVRRFFQYALLLAVVSIVATGASGLLADIIPGAALLRDSSDRNAQSLAFLLIGVPALYGLTRWVSITLANEDDRRSLAWALYVGTAALTALITAATGLFRVGEAILGIVEFDRPSLARGVVWGIVWWVHFNIAARQRHEYRLRLHLFGGSAIGLFISAVAFGGVVSAALSAIYESLFDIAIVSREPNLIQQAIVGLVIGLLIWARYWISTYSRLTRDVTWHAYVLLAGVLGGLATLLIGTTLLLFSVLDWFFGAGDAAAGRHFEEVPVVIATIAVGSLVWSYHRAMLRAEGPTARTETDRIYEYLVSAVGLLATAGGVATIIVALIQVTLPNTVVLLSGETSTLLAAIAVLVVGVPVWWRTWSAIQHHRGDNPTQELASPSRRIYLFALFGLGGVAALISLLTLAVTALEDMFDGAFGSQSIYEIRWSFALVVTIGAVAAYHWFIRKEDQIDAPAEVDVVHEVRMVVLVSGDGRAIADQVTEQTGVRVRVWDRPGSDTTTSTEAVVDAIAAASHPRLLLIANDDQLQVMPYTERN